MAYSKKTWIDDELITRDALNNIENGIDTIDKSMPTKATSEKEGLVKQGVAVSDASGTNVTKEEFNALLTSLRNAGILALL